MADASASLQALLSTKAALDLGLVTPADYDAVKRAFLAAQQIRAAVDAGLVAEGDYEATKARYLAELLAQGGGLGGGGSEAAAAAAPAANGAPRAAAPPQPPAPRAAAPPPPPAPRAPAPPAPPAPPPPQPAAAPPPQPAAPPPQQQPAAGVPANLPRVGGAKPVGAGTSMSGIRLTEDAVNLFYLIRSKSAYQWATWRVDDSGAAVVIAAVGAPGAPYADFLAALPEDDCRYGGAR
jgi:cofilin